MSILYVLAHHHDSYCYVHISYNEYVSSMEAHFRCFIEEIEDWGG